MKNGRFLAVFDQCAAGEIDLETPVVLLVAVS